MKALVYTGTEKLEYKDFNDPSITNGESIIKPALFTLVLLGKKFIIEFCDGI